MMPNSKIWEREIKKVSKLVLAQKDEPGFDGVYSIYDSLCLTYGNNNKQRWTFGDNHEIKINPDDFTIGLRAQFCDSVKKLVVKKLHLKKNQVIAPQNAYDWSCTKSAFYGEDIRFEFCKNFKVITLCPEFFKMCKRFEALGLPPINVYDWRRDYVFGKRSNYDVTSSFYFATDSKYCIRVIEFLKGKHKGNVSYSFKRCENLNDREHGEYYETEWSGSIDNLIQIMVKGSKNNYLW